MAIVARAIDFIARVFEFLTVGRQQLEFLAATLRKNRVTRVAVIGVYRAPAVSRFMHAVMTTEATGPIFVADIIRISFPARSHFREEIVFVNLLDCFNCRTDSWIISVAIGEDRCYAFESACFVGI